MEKPLNQNNLIFYASDFCNTEMWMGVLEALGIDFDLDENQEPTIQEISINCKVVDVG